MKGSKTPAKKAKDLPAKSSSVKGGGVLFGAIVGAFLFASAGGASFLVAFLAG